MPCVRTRSRSESRARFSWPEYVWTTNHFFAIACSRVSPAMFMGPANLSVNPVGQPRPDHIEQAEEHRGDDDRHDDHQGGGLRLLARRPGDLLELGRDLVGHGVDAFVPVGHDADGQREQRGPGVDRELVGMPGKIAPDPLPRPVEEEEQDEATAQEHQVDCLVWTHVPVFSLKAPHAAAYGVRLYARLRKLLQTWWRRTP